MVLGDEDYENLFCAQGPDLPKEAKNDFCQLSSECVNQFFSEQFLASLCRALQENTKKKRPFSGLCLPNCSSSPERAELGGGSQVLKIDWPGKRRDGHKSSVLKGREVLLRHFLAVLKPNSLALSLSEARSQKKVK